ncbi:CGNR zinc finger domain-containing protein [Micromonospora sp. WMMD737]|uniref:CGNR zinc finger domain-containing protein n=1 Tax=Micromonospora sp. WMMD737 TaxID=3404113 RepID=UPI003B93ED21
MSDQAGVPAAARLVLDLVNTFEPQVGEETLTSPDRLRDWLVERDLVEAGTRLAPSDVATITTIREHLRTVLRAHAGPPVDVVPVAHQRLNQALAGFPVRLVFAGGSFRLVSVEDEPLHRALGGLMDALRRCAEEHSWGRLKVCDRDTCRWAFYDASRNQTRRWCSMAGCGNYVKMRRAHAVRKSRAAAP